MKKIHLIRHAKSAWDQLLLDDIDRPLNKRGVRTCAFMAQHMYDSGLQFANVFCSPATRAQLTIELINQHLSEIDIQWQTTVDLYCFDSTSLLQWCRNLDDSLTEVTLVGHNPAFTDLCNILCDERQTSYIENIPTCGYVELEMKVASSWRNIAANSFKRNKFLRPKELQK